METGRSSSWPAVAAPLHRRAYDDATRTWLAPPPAAAPCLCPEVDAPPPRLCAPGDECAGGFLALADTCPRGEFSFEGFARCSSTL